MEKTGMTCSCGHAKEDHVNGYCRARRMVEATAGKNTFIECGCAVYRDGVATGVADDPEVEVFHDGRGK